MERKSGKLFSSPLLQALTTTSPALILGMYIPVIIGLPLLLHLRYNLEFQDISLAFLLGVALWSFTEYWLHRKVFHWVGESKTSQRLHYLVHGYHHTYPRDKDHLFMPVIPSVVLATTFCLLFWTIVDNIGLATFSGFLAGYLVYASMHYSMHTISLPPKWLRPLWRHHHLHHSTSPNKAFGVSSVIWDKIFQTMPVKK